MLLPETRRLEVQLSNAPLLCLLHAMHLEAQQLIRTPCDIGSSSQGSKQLLLHFGAVDYEAEIFLNGKSVGTHRGGYLPFSFDITPYVTASGPQ